jgi:hypothetical protein
VIKRAITVTALVLLAGCSATSTRAPSTDEAQTAMQVDVAQAAQQAHMSAANVIVVAVGACTPSANHPITTCEIKWSAGGQQITNEVSFWTTPNPRHPWRAHIISQPSAR